MFKFSIDLIETFDYNYSTAPVEILSLADRNRHRLQRLAGQRGKRSNVDQREVNGPHENRENNVRNKRDTTQHIVEMAFVVDYADYEK